MPTTQLGISLKPTCLVILLVLNVKEWPELNGEKREPTTGKWAKGLTRVTNKKRTVMAKSALRGRASRFFIPQTVTQTAVKEFSFDRELGGKRHAVTLTLEVKAGDQIHFILTKDVPNSPYFYPTVTYTQNEKTGEVTDFVMKPWEDKA